MNLGPDIPGGSGQSHPLYPQGPLSETREEEAQAKGRSRVRPPRLLEKIQSWPSSSARTGLCPGKGSLPCSTACRSFPRRQTSPHCGSGSKQSPLRPQDEVSLHQHHDSYPFWADSDPTSQNALSLLFAHLSGNEIPLWEVPRATPSFHEGCFQTRVICSLENICHVYSACWHPTEFRTVHHNKY